MDNQTKWTCTSSLFIVYTLFISFNKKSLIVIDCMKRFCKDLKEHATKIINYEIKEMILLTDKANKSYEKQKVSYQKSRNNFPYTEKDRKATHSIFNLRYKTPGSTHNYYLIIKELAKELEGQIECLGENTQKYITFSVLFEKELDNGKTITYKLKFIDSFRFMSTSLSKRVKEKLNHYLIL